MQKNASNLHSPSGFRNAFIMESMVAKDCCEYSLHRFILWKNTKPNQRAYQFLEAYRARRKFSKSTKRKWNTLKAVSFEIPIVLKNSWLLQLWRRKRVDKCQAQECWKDSHSGLRKSYLLQPFECQVPLIILPGTWAWKAPCNARWNHIWRFSFLK